MEWTRPKRIFQILNYKPNPPKWKPDSTDVVTRMEKTRECECPVPRSNVLDVELLGEILRDYFHVFHNRRLLPYPGRPTHSVFLSQKGEELQALRQAYRRAKTSLDRMESHDEFMQECLATGKTPKGLRVPVKCHALLPHYSDVEECFRATKSRA